MLPKFFFVVGQAKEHRHVRNKFINVRVPDTTPRSIVVTSSQMNLIAYSSFLFLPLAVLAAGAAVWWTRR